jgi:hypothetical protein
LSGRDLVPCPDRCDRTPALALSGWIPFSVRANDARPRPVVDWCFLGEDTFADPFFEQTIERCWRRPFNQLFSHETPIESLLDWSAAQPGIAPTAFIFHSSRCGSTLLARMAAAMPRTVVISEAPPIDHILRARAPEDARIGWFRALLSALGQPRRGGEQHLFIKFDAWHVIDLALVQRAFPQVPCVFLYREPAALIASQLRMPGIHTLPGMLDLTSIGLDLPRVLRLDRDEYTGRILAAIFAAALAHAAAGRVSLMNYAQLPSAASSQVLAWCGLTGSEDARERLEHVARFDAKTPSLPYDASEVSTRPPPSRRAIDMAARFVDPYYAQLESIRLGPADRIAS